MYNVDPDDLRDSVDVIDREADGQGLYLLPFLNLYPRSFITMYFNNINILIYIS